jgi:hypothetical protein
MEVRMSRHLINRSAAVAMAAMLLFGTVSNVFATVSTDQPDYSPGSVVTISGDNSNGAGYLAGETVHVDVSGPNGYASSCDGVADDNGAWSCQVTLWSDDLAVGAYTYVATGQTSGTSETGTFTDATAFALNQPNATGSPGFVWHRTGEVAGGFNVVVSGTYRCQTTGGSPSCTSASVFITFHATNGAAGVGPVLQVSAVNVQKTISLAGGAGSNTAWSTTFEFRTAPGAGQFGIPPDNTYEVKAVFTPSSGAADAITRSNEDSFGVDNTPPAATVATAAPNPNNITATGTATDTGSGIANGDVAVKLYSDDTANDLSCAGTLTLLDSAAANSGNWSNTFGGGIGTAQGDYCVTAQATDKAGNVSSVASRYYHITAVTSTSPSDGATGVSPSSNVSVTYSDPVNVSTSPSWIGVTCTTSGAHAGATSGGGTSTVSFNPTVDFSAGDVCTATVTNSRVTPTGTQYYLVGNTFLFNFTVAAPDTTDPTNVSIEINGGAAWTNTTAATLHIHGEDDVGVTGYFVANGGTATCDAAPFGSYAAVGPTTSYDNNALAHVLTAGDGTKTVCVVFRDAAGNTSSAQDTIGLDATAPVITKSIPGTPQYNDGTNDFVTSATTIRVSVVEAGSGLDSCVIDIDGPAANDTSFNCTTSDNDFTLGGVLATPPDGSYVISVDAEDVAGNPGNDPLTVILDNTAPDNYSETLGSPNYTDGSNNVWVRSTTNISVSGDDGTGSGVKSCTKAFDGGATSAYTLAANFNMPSGDGAHSYAIVCKDNLDNTSGPFSKTRYVDDTGPVVTVTGVTNGATYILGSVPAAGCGTSDGAGSGVATSASLTGPTGLGPNGVGTANGSCGGATDNLGNPQSPDPLSFTFYVIYDPAGISGILQPINPDNTSVFKRGQSVPVKFSLAGDEFFGFVTSGWLIQRQSVLCNVFDGNDATLESVPSNTPSQYFRYDASADQYIYNADMKNLGVGTCWNFKVTLDSGQILYSAVFKLTK